MLKYNCVMIFALIFVVPAMGYDLPFSDHFDSPQTVSSLPNATQWTSVYTLGGTVAVDDGDSIDGGQSLKIVDNSTSSLVMFKTNGILREPNGNVTPKRIGYSFSVRPMQTTGRLTLSARASSGEKVYFNIIFDTDGKLKFEDGNGTTELLSAYSITGFNRIEILIDIDSNLYTATVNGVDKVVSASLDPVNPLACSIDVLRIMTDSTTTGTYYIDALDMVSIPPLTTAVSAGTYYVDPDNGDDTNSGTSSNSAWQTLWKVRNTVFSDNSTISFKRDASWLESMVVPFKTSGSNGITLNAYGTGDRPKIGHHIDVSSGYQFLKNTSFEESSGTVDDSNADFFSAWHISGSGEIQTDSYDGNRSCKLIANTTLSQKVRIGYSSCPLTLSFAAKAASAGQTVKLRVIHYRADGTTSYMYLNGSTPVWTTTPTDFQTFNLTTSWAAYSSNNFYYADTSISYNCEVQWIIGGTGAVYLDDAKLSSSWRKRDATNNIYELNVGAMAGPFMADWSGGNNLAMVPGSGKTYTDPANALNHTFDYRYYCIYVRDDNGGATAPSGHLGAAALDFSTLVKGKKGVTLESLDISGGKFEYYSKLPDGWNWYPHFAAYTSGLAIIYCEDITVDDCLIHANGGANIAMTGAGDFAGDGDTINDNITIKNCGVYQAVNEGMRCRGTNMLIQNNEVYDNTLYAGGDGNAIGIYSGSQYVTVEDNSVHDNGSISGSCMDVAISCYDADDIIIRYNDIYDNYNGGIYVSGWRHPYPDNVAIYYNIISNNGRSISDDINHNVLTFHYVDSAEVYNNTIVNNTCGVDTNAPGAVMISHYVQDTLFKNNIVVDNSAVDAQLYVGSTGISNLTFNKNIYYNSGGGTLVDWQGTNYSINDEASYQSAHEANSYFSDPGLIDIANRNFFLQPWSEAYNSGDDVSLSEDFWGVSVPVNSTVERGACETLLCNASIEFGSGTADDNIRDSFTNWFTGGSDVLDFTTDKHSGNYALKWNIPAEGATNTFYQNFPMNAPGSTYTVRFWCKVPTGTLTAYARYWNGTSWASLGGQSYSNISSWTEQSFTITPPAGGSSYRVVFYNSQVPTTAYLDDISVSLVNSD